jgi:Ca2+/Na+ antiporter
MSKILDFLPPMIVGLAFIYMVAVVVTSVLESRRRAAATRARSEILNRILDKFGSSRDFVELSESPAGRRLLEALGSEPNGVGEKILSAVQRGVVLTVLGLGVLVLSLTIYETAVEEFIRIVGAVALALGVGYLGSSALSFRMARSIGLLTPHPEQTLPQSGDLA